ncbi:MAG TPA: DUF2231 domain-containing protein [Terriglobia bacterium]|nr:DUF2231 domain-containing protein [Terriglobia bacterium]
MNRKARFLGHLIHPMLIVFPLGLLATAVVFDLISLFSGNPLWTGIAFYMIGAGVVGGLLAAVFGLWDWRTIPSGTRARAVGAWHGLVNVVVVILFVGSWALRYDHPLVPGALALTLSFVAGALAGVGGWLGGELVERLGVGIDPNAGLNAPGSLSGSRDDRRDAA